MVALLLSKRGNQGQRYDEFSLKFSLDSEPLITTSYSWKQLLAQFLENHFQFLVIGTEKTEDIDTIAHIVLSDNLPIASSLAHASRASTTM